jgi:alanine dehydrogenase
MANTAPTQTQRYSVGFPRMHKEAGERRDFLPDLIRRIAPLTREVVVEEDIGAGMGITLAEYTTGVDNVRAGSNLECYRQDIVIQVRSPEDDELTRMRPGAILFSMLHFLTHPQRVTLMQELGLRPIAMDGVTNDDSARLIENLRGTSWNAIWAGFQALLKTYPAFMSPHRDPIRATIIGAGAVGRYAAEAAAKYGDVAALEGMWEQQIPGVVALLVDRRVTGNRDWLKRLLVASDMLVDATGRADTTQSIIPNELIGYLPEHAIVVDLAADPYNTEIRPIQVKGIEGIPTGTLSEYEFPPDHPAFDALPAEVSTAHRRMTVSCYSWPGLRPQDCMQRYGRQIEPLLRILLRKPFDELTLSSAEHFERALYRGTLSYFLERRGEPST